MDLNNDGYIDILSGQYLPGKVFWWKGSEKGFLPQETVKQEGFPEDPRSLTNKKPDDPNGPGYWRSTFISLSDFNKDGLLDLFVSGNGGLRVAINKGTKSNPRFGLRKRLLDIDGKPLEIIKAKHIKSSSLYSSVSGDSKNYINFIDWDNDGVEDIIVSNSYYKKEFPNVSFFKGIKTDKGLRFKKPIELFRAKNGQKAIPGDCPYVKVVDYNSDGINDLIVGVGLCTFNGFNISKEHLWKYATETKIKLQGKNPGYYPFSEHEDFRQWKINNYTKQIEAGNDVDSYTKLLNKAKKPFTEKEKYELTQRHRGYVYVILGKKNPNKAVKTSIVKAKDEQPIVWVEEK